MRVAVAGGTGLIGTMVVDRLAEAGHEPVVLSRSRGVDLTTGAGLAAALAGCAAVVDASNVTTMRRAVSVDFFGAVARNLLAAGVDAGIDHVVVLSIVGVDEVDLGYYFGKREQEKLVSGGPLPWTILRATQFHEFPDSLIEGAVGPFVPVPRMLSRPVAAAEVAAALVDLVLKPAGGYVQPIAGPEELWMADMTRRYVRARGERKVLVPIRLPGQAGKRMAAGGLLPDGPYTRGVQTFAEFLDHVRRDLTGPVR
ncbi:SDR family oxidoreductase [Umezawaea endophytica]|uniref:NAD(P)H-binding protein n=1 Tax=Umezawaea endophytica TaxID=1654476 RepID=A0A9X3AFL2_9PSEU|nr:NAD(P)H-binding protein [Umezawaea endophytica]MCS7478456.1 NAD(P)H-binding protein [Umezawaea endophytica]